MNTVQILMDYSAVTEALRTTVPEWDPVTTWGAEIARLVAGLLNEFPDEFTCDRFEGMHPASIFDFRALAEADGSITDSFELGDLYSVMNEDLLTSELAAMGFDADSLDQLRVMVDIDPSTGGLLVQIFDLGDSVNRGGYRTTMSEALRAAVAPIDDEDEDLEDEFEDEDDLDDDDEGDEL